MFRRRGLFRELPKLKSSNHFVAYIDILGARKLMEQQNDKFLNDLNSIYFDTLNEVILTNVVSNKDIYLKIFSDNILILILHDKIICRCSFSRQYHILERSVDIDQVS